MPVPTLRLFFALWPDAATRTIIGEVARQVAAESHGRAVASDNIHLTLAFLGTQPVASVPELRSLAAAIRKQPCVLKLDEIGCFRKTGIAWLGASSPPANVVSLQAELVRRLAATGIPPDARPFSPHLTLARRASIVVRRRLIEPVSWNMDSFALVASQLGSEAPRYRLLDEWRAPGAA